ncbi:FtsX-like permease family protein [Streptomyces sp. So13.3]|uniref:ABC transporter permease n=1 Tax=Streptomyces sp. So13.3 TaxID=2136173 RepID=UPI00164E0A4E|nr:FtsX-like permease family protein [Streptomyces sp. So13.3]
MLRYALQTLRARKGGFAGAFLALFCAAALVTACGVLLETGLRGEIATERYAAAPIVVGADQNVHQTTVKEKKGKTKVKNKAKPLAERVWLPDTTVRTVRQVPGVRAAVPEVTFPAYAVGRGADRSGPLSGKPSFGHDWASAVLTPFTLTEGRAPQTDGDLVIDRELAGRMGLKPGSSVTVQSTRAPRSYRVTGIAAAQDGDLRQQTSLFFTTAEAGRLAGHPGQITAIGVLPEPGADTGALATNLATALQGTKVQVHTGADRGPVEFPDAAKARIKLVSMGGAIGGTSLLVAVLVVVGTFALTIQQRYREIALLRAIAATPKQIRRLIGREALLVGLAAGALGSVAGLPVAYWLHAEFVGFGAVPDTLRIAWSPFPMFAAVGAALLGGWSAARISARRASRIRPAEALSEAAMETRTSPWGRLLAGGLFLAGGIVLLVVLSGLRTEPASTPVTFLTVVVLAVAVSLLGPLLARIAAAVLAVPLRASRIGGHLAAANVRTNSKRLSAAVTPLALLVGMTCTVIFVQTTMGHAAQQQASAGNRAQWVLGAAAPGVPGEAAAAVRQVPGVTAVTEVVRTSVRVGLSKYTAQGVTPAGLTTTWDPDVTQGTLRGFGDGDIALSEVAADGLGVRPGSTVRLTLGDGTPAALKVTAVYARGLGFGDLTMSHDLVARHVDNPLASAVLVATDGRADRAALGAAVKDFPGVAVLDHDQAGAVQAEVQQSNAEVNYLAMGLVLAFTAIAVVNTLAMSTADRSREFALLRLVGTTRRQVLRMLRLEALTVVLVGAVLGTAIALATLTAFSLGMTGAAAPRLDPAGYLLIVALAAGLALLATALPARLALRVRPAEAIG